MALTATLGLAAACRPAAASVMHNVVAGLGGGEGPLGFGTHPGAYARRTRRVRTVPYSPIPSRTGRGPEGQAPYARRSAASMTSRPATASSSVTGGGASPRSAAATAG